MELYNSQVCTSCYVLVIFLYSFLMTAIEATCIFVGLFLLIMPILFYFLLSQFAIPKPSKSAVKEILGVDVWNAHKERTANGGVEENNAEDTDELTLRTIGHRACGLDAPENSIAALKTCTNSGCQCVEIDLSMTLDGVPVVFHDWTLDRMTDHSGLIDRTTWEDLKKLDLVFRPNMKQSDKFSGEKVARFDEFIDLCLELGARVFIDIKDRRDEIAKVVTETFKRHPELYKMAVVSSFNPIIIYKIRSIEPRIVCSMAWRPDYFSLTKFDPVHGAAPRYRSLFMHYGAKLLDLVTTWLFHNITYYLLGLSAVLLHKESINGAVVSKWQNRDVRVIAWTVNSRLEKDFFANVLNIPYMTDTLEYSHLKSAQGQSQH